MFWFIVGVIVFIIGIILALVGRRARKLGKENSDNDQQSVGAGGYILGAIFMIGGTIWIVTSCFFTLDVGESAVIKSVTGSIDGQVSSAGLHTKAPWEDAVTYDIRNQRVVYVNPNHSTGDNSGGNADGREINVNDIDGVATDVDVTIRYNISPASVVTIYKNFKTNDNLKSILIFNDLRDAVRSAAGKLHTIQVLSDHPLYASDVKNTLQAKWDKYGIEIDDVSIQQTVPPKAVSDAYAVAQKSQIEVQKAQNDLDATKISTQEQVVKAQATADANKILAKSLTPEILQQKYIDALKTGTIYVVPSGSTPLITTK